MQFIVALIKKLPILPIGLFVGGLLLGLLIGWVIAPVEFVDATPAYLRADLQEDYLRMAIDSFRLNSDNTTAFFSSRSNHGFERQNRGLLLRCSNTHKDDICRSWKRPEARLWRQRTTGRSGRASWP